MICDNTEDASDFMRMGVQGVIYRSARGSMVVEAVRRLAQGQSFLQSPNSAEIEVNDDVVGARVRKRLSDRELQIIAAIVQGYKNREIAAQLYTSEQVVKNALRISSTRLASRTVWNWPSSWCTTGSWLKLPPR